MYKTEAERNGWRQTVYTRLALEAMNLTSRRLLVREPRCRGRKLLSPENCWKDFEFNCVDRKMHSHRAHVALTHAITTLSQFSIRRRFLRWAEFLHMRFPSAARDREHLPCLIEVSVGMSPSRSLRTNSFKTAFQIGWKSRKCGSSLRKVRMSICTSKSCKKNSQNWSEHHSLTRKYSDYFFLLSLSLQINTRPKNFWRISILILFLGPFFICVQLKQLIREY